MAQKKSTKKFEKNHLQAALKKRHDQSKIKKRVQIKEKRKARNANSKQQDEASVVEGGKAVLAKNTESSSIFGDMSVEDFFASGFNVSDKPINGTSGAKRSGKRKRPESEEEDEDLASVASVEEHAGFGESGLEQEEEEEEEEEEEKQEHVDSAGAHEEDLKMLEKKDPEFYNYLKENDAELLAFTEDSNFPDFGELSDSEAEDAGAASGKAAAKTKDDKTSHEITKPTVKKWSTAMTEQKSLRAMREVILAFRAAAHQNEDEGKEYKYTLSSANVYHEILVCALQQVPNVLNHHLPLKESANGKIRVPTDTKKFRTLSPLLKTHTISVQHLLENLGDPGTMTMTLASLLELLPYTLSFKKLVRDLARAVAEIWSDPVHSESTRIHAFLILRRLVVIGDPSIKENVLRTAYQGLIKGSRTTTIHNIAGINLMKNSATELWGLADSSIAYTTGFNFIRQLAIHLRNSIKHNANESFKTVYNWQFVHSLDFWSRVLSMHCDTLREARLASGSTKKGAKAESPLRPLIYPLVQVTLGTMRLIPTSAYFPLRFQLIRSLLRVSRTTNSFIPLAAPLYEVLASAELKKPPKPSTIAPIDWPTSIRAQKSYLRTRVYQDGTADQVAELMADFFALWCKSVAFPELALPVVVLLKRWLKEVSPTSRGAHANGKSPIRGNKNSKVSSMVSLLVQKLESNSRWIEERRAKVEFAPNDRAGVDGFLKDVEWTKTPLGAFVEGQRKAREEKTRVIEEGRRRDKRGRDDEDREPQAVDGFSGDDSSAMEEFEDE